ncbi:MAG TPA: hypothetical protein VJN22_00480 [Candidatus Eremiobacteraceae bacterium]|nr:hypothetical protein [Candidatus Eremiobacteraceae bacterium]
MRTFSLWAAAACALALTSLLPATAGSSAPASDTALAGKMAAMQYLLGSWNCKVQISAMMGQPAATAEGVLTYSAVPGNALHAHVTAKEYASDSYSGFDDKKQTFWLNTVDGYANVSSESSSDGKVFSGPSTGSQGKMQIRDTFSRPASNTIRDLQEYQSKGVWQTASDSTCTRI